MKHNTEEFRDFMKKIAFMRPNSYHTIQCQYCKVELQRSKNVKVGTCYDCRKKKQAMRDTHRATLKRSSRK